MAAVADVPDPSLPRRKRPLWIWLLLAAWLFWLGGLAWLGRGEWDKKRPADLPVKASPRGSAAHE